MGIGATANVPTAHASKYLQQLCKHWQHNLAVEFTPERAGTYEFTCGMSMLRGRLTVVDEKEG